MSGSPGLSRSCRPLAGLAALLSMTASAGARTLVSADGPGGVATYQLLGKAYGIEVPDCGHMVPHITEEFDQELGKDVFVFQLHVNEDDDRCMATDRQRTEIRGKLADLVANLGETVHYRWKFKLPVGFQTSPNFTHIFQIKSDAASPVMTLTPRLASISIDGVVGVHGTAALAPFLGTWVVVDLTVLYGTAGHLDMTIRRLAGGQTLLSYAGDADTWQGSDTGHDPKFGLYRSLASKTSLRDEQVRFADFCVSKVSAAECDDGPFTPPDAGPDAARADVGVAPSPDAAAPPPDVAPPRADTAIVIPPPPPDAGTVTPPADAAVVVPPPVDAASTPPPKLDAAVAGPAPDAATPDARLDPPDQATRPPDAATPATVTPDAAAGAAPDDGAPVAADGATSDPVGPTGGGSGRARRPGQRGCQLAAGAEAGWPWPVPLLLAAALALHRRRR